MADFEFESGSLAALLRLGDLVTPLAIRTANSLGIADHLYDEPTPAQVLAERLSVKVEPLLRLLRLLVHVGVLSQDDSGAFSLTETGAPMRSNHPLSMRDAFVLAIPEIRAWTELEYCIRTGGSGFEHSYGETHRSYRSRYLEEDIRMDRAHKAATRVELLGLAVAYQWAQVHTIVDVGGGTGMFLAGILRRFPNLHGTLFDLPRMIANADEVIREYNVVDRCRLVAGDFFEDVPSDGDAYVLKAVVGGWNDESCIRILTSVCRAMRADSRALIIEPITELGRQFSRGNLVQLQSLVLYGGKDRSIDDYRSLAGPAGLQVRRVIPRATLSIIELVRQ
jgi:hypothetical protein